MSIADLLVSNHYNLFTNSTYIEESFSANVVSDQTLSTSATALIVFPTIEVSSVTGAYVSPSYTIPASGVYHFNATVPINYTITTADEVEVSISLIKNSSIVITSNNKSPVAAGGTVAVQLPIIWYGFFNVGDVISIQGNIPISVAHGAGNITLYQSLAAGCVFYGNRG
jgi:hypothetical protein